MPPVHVGATRLRIARGETCRRERVAERDERGNEQRDGESGASGRGGRRERHEHPGTEHRPEADGDRIHRGEAAPESVRSSGWRRHVTIVADPDKKGDGNLAPDRVIPSLLSVARGVSGGSVSPPKTPCVSVESVL